MRWKYKESMQGVKKEGSFQISVFRCSLVFIPRSSAKPSELDKFSGLSRQLVPPIQFRSLCQKLVHPWHVCTFMALAKFEGCRQVELAALALPH